MAVFSNSVVGVRGITFRPWVLVRTDSIVWFGQLLGDKPESTVRLHSAVPLVGGGGKGLPGFDASAEACLELSCQGFRPADLEVVAAWVIKGWSSVVHVVDYREVYELSHEAWRAFSDALPRVEVRGRPAPLPVALCDPASSAIAAAAWWPMGWDKMPRGFKGE